MAAPDQLLLNLRGEGVPFGPENIRPPLMVDPWSIDRRLKLVPVNDDVEENLGGSRRNP